MKVIQINNVCGKGSTGKICVGISRILESFSIENYIIYSQGDSDYPHSIKCSENFFKLQIIKSRLLGNYGFNSKRTTMNIIRVLEHFNPDIVHLHNLHAHNCNLEVLLRYLQSKKLKIIWTFHDCWAFTAYCPHYTMAKCNKWETECQNCIQHKLFSWINDNSREVFTRKKDLLSGIDFVITTPSEWLATNVKKSFLKRHKIKIIHNGINTDIFNLYESDFRAKKGISKEKFVILGVAIEWVSRKGLDVFVRLSEKLDTDIFQIVLVGTDDKVDKLLPANIISIHRTSSQQELAEIYSAADLFVNPTREEVFGLVNVEANACGTPVLTYRTGGSPECIDEKSGMVVECDDEKALYEAILKIEKERPFSSDDCRKRALLFDEKKKYNEYVDLYLEVLGKKDNNK